MATQVTGELYYNLDGQLAEIKRQLRQPNGYPFDPRHLQLALQAAIEGRFSNGVAQLVPSDEFVVSVDYSQSLADMIKAGNYDWANSDIDPKRFPIKGTGVVGRKLWLWHFDRDIESSEAERLIRASGQEPAPIEDLLAFGATFPEKQREYPIIALGSSAQVNGSRFVPSLDKYGAKRDLHLHWYARRWPRNCRFLAREVSAA